MEAEVDTEFGRVDDLRADRVHQIGNATVQTGFELPVRIAQILLAVVANGDKRKIKILGFGEIQ